MGYVSFREGSNVCFFVSARITKVSKVSGMEALNKFRCVSSVHLIPIGSMYGIFTYIWLICMVNVGKYTIHGSYGISTADVQVPCFGVVDQ